MTVTTTPTNVAVDYSSCIRSQSEIGKTITHNICNGEMVVVPWGALDWLGVITIGGLMGAITLLALAFAAMVVRSAWDGW